MKFVGVVGWEKAEDVPCCLFLYFAFAKKTLELDSVIILNFDNKKQKTKFKNQAKIKNDVQNENFRLRMQKTMSDLYLVYEIQKTKYKIQNTKYKIQNTTMVMIHVNCHIRQLKLNTWFLRDAYLF